MFKRKPRKTFSVSTQVVYFTGKKSWFSKLTPYRGFTKRAVYRTPGTLLAL